MGGPQKVWTAADEATLREMVAAGEKRSAIAAAICRTEGAVTARVFKLGIATQSRIHPVWTDANFTTLEAMLAAGDSLPAIARVLKRNQTDVAARAFAIRKGLQTMI